MTFITLNRPDTYKAIIPTGNGQIKRVWIKQEPITINPQYIVSMVEMYDSNHDFEYTEINLSNESWYRVSSKIEEIIEMLNKGEE